MVYLSNWSWQLIRDQFRWLHKLCKSWHPTTDGNVGNDKKSILYSEKLICFEKPLNGNCTKIFYLSLARLKLSKLEGIDLNVVLQASKIQENKECMRK